MNNKKKALVIGIALVATLACLLLALRARERGAPTDLSATAPEPPSSSTGHPQKVMAQPVGRREVIGQALAEPAEVPNEATQPTPVVERARDGYYERLLTKQGRDQAKEQQVLAGLMTVFGESPDTLIGAVACSPEFCRVDLRGEGEIDVRQRWKKELVAAVEPRGLRFFIVAADDEGNTLTSFYFGRDGSWTVPDFHALGML